MGTIAIRAKQKIRSVKDKWKEIYMRHRYLSGITVIELVLILVIVIAGRYFQKPADRSDQYDI